MNTATIPIFYGAVEPDSLIAVLWHIFGIFVIRLPVTVEFSQSFQATLIGEQN